MDGDSMPVALPPPPEEKEQQQQQQPAADAIQLQPLESDLGQAVKENREKTSQGQISSQDTNFLNHAQRGSFADEDIKILLKCARQLNPMLDYVDTSCCSRNLICGESYYRVGAALSNPEGWTCFVNCILQCVVHTVPLVLKLQKDDHTDACPGASGKFCCYCSLKFHADEVISLSGAVLYPKKFVEHLKLFSENFRWGRHQDAHEFLRCLLDKLDEASVPPRSPSSERPSSIVTQVFGGQLKSQLHCPECNYCSDRLEPFLDLNLEVIPMATVMDALKSFTKIEVFENYGCDGCRSRVNMEKQLKVEQAPEVLVIQLKRFQNFGSHITKIEDCMMYQEELDLNPFMSSADNKPQKYDLYGVVEHEGAPSNGHYVCYIRSSRTNWFHFNDSKVMKINDVMALESEAYLLFYAKQGSSPWFSTLLKRKNNVSGDTEEGGYSSNSSEDDYYPEGLSWHNDGDKTRSATKEETDLQLRQIISMQKEKCGEREIEEKAKAEGDSSIQTTCPESLSWRKEADVKGSDDSPAGPLLGPAGSHSDNIAKGKRTYKAIVQEETTPDELLQHLKEMVPSIFAKALEGMHTSLALSEALKREHVVEMHNDDDDKTRSVRKRKWEWDNNLKVVEEEEEEEEEDDDVEEEPYYYVYSD
ncbi:ubiquitin carboxyl-terminal hydrolase 19-like isoform X1 [Triticum urartu]|uniref:USP domain-containing protein n=1 Tax=Triticum urartu TaxID=4572 RepID=A0A8R7P4G7_TRIUA|nr:ubiquitin carboxyl-terminal hydrolase 19-like isoform X1 [Triticum urartu]